jgi:hypothetical protein
MNLKQVPTPSIVNQHSLFVTLISKAISPWSRGTDKQLNGNPQFESQ